MLITSWWRSWLLRSVSSVGRNSGQTRRGTRLARERRRPSVQLIGRRERNSIEFLEDRTLLATITVTSLADNTTVDGQVTLREAIQAANLNQAVDGSTAGEVGADTIVFDAALTSGGAGSILLTGGQMDITQALTINGPGADLLTIDAQSNSRIFATAGGSFGLTLSGLTLTGGEASSDGGAVFFGTTGDLTLDQVSVTGSRTTGNSAEGGGIFAQGNVVLTSSTVSGNSTTGDSSSGGGILANGDVTLINTTVSGNSTSGGNSVGGGVVAVGALTVIDSTITNNHSISSDGGGLFRATTGSNHPLTISGSIIAGNTSSGSGPDFRPGPDPTLTVTNSLIGNNSDTGLAEAPLGSVDIDGNLIGTSASPIDPLLGPLADNGGPTFTHLPQANSPAIDPFPIYTNVVQASSPLIYYRMNESGQAGAGGFGVLIENAGSSGAAQNADGLSLGIGAFDGPEFFPGFGQNITLNGDNANIRIPEIDRDSATGPDSFSNLTFETWIRVNSLDRGAFLYKGDRTASGHQLEILLEKEGRVQLGFEAAGNTLSTADNVIKEGTWHHIAVTFGQAAETIFVDGRVAAQGGVGNVGVPAALAEARIGTVFDTGDNLSAAIDEFAIFDRVLSEAEIRQHYLARPDLAPLAEFRFEEGGGTVAVDSSGRDHSAEYIGGVLLDQPSRPLPLDGRAARFDGINDHVSVALDASETAQTVSLWFRTTVLNGGLFSVSQGGTLPNPVFNGQQVYLNNGNIAARGDSETITSSGLTLNDDEWHNVTHVFGPDGHKLYVDGVEVASGSETSSSFTLQDRVVIGHADDANNLEYFFGLIDDVLIFDRALNAAQVQSLVAPGVDQRGTPRRLSEFRDMGAVELVSPDFGDAPDAAAGTGEGNYETLAASGGPSHRVVGGLRLGRNIDPEDDAAQNLTANGDDLAGVLPDDEDGVLSPLDLVGTIGAAPTVTLLVTNLTGGNATLSGWIDYNQNGVFDNATERAQVVVPDGSGDQRLTLTFPAINASAMTGTTYARFRLSTDASGQNPIGAADDGEVEDYVFEITAPNRGTVDSFLKITGDTPNGPTLANGDAFGRSVTAIGDIDGDGVVDLAVGANGDDTGGGSAGAVHVLRMNADGSVKGATKIADETNGGPVLVGGDYFGTTVSSIGDVDGDGVPDLAVGAFGDDTNGTFRGAVYVLFLNTDGTAKSVTKIADGTGSLPADTLVNRDFFGQSVSSPGDLDGDGVPDLAVGARGDDTGGSTRGAVHILRLNADGTVKSSTKIAHETNGGPTLADGDALGRSVAAIGDVNGDGVPDLAAGASLDDTGGTDRGAIHVLLLNADGSVQSSAKIAHETGGGPTLADDDNFGFDVASIGDVDGDGVPDLAAGTYTDDTGNDRGTVQVLLLNENGTAKAFTTIAHQTGGGPTLANDDFFGITLSSVGDLNGDGRVDLAVGASGDDTGGSGRGALHLLFLDEVQVDFGDAPDTSGGTGAGDYRTTAADNGPSHGSREGFGLRLGANIDGDDGTQQNKRADGDDTANSQTAAGFQFDDEDGVLSPATDLHGTIGAAPTVTLLVTNTTGRDATLSGWIDYNANGDFDNATERTQATIPTGSQDLRVTLTFPAITAAATTGKTYARFRLSTDAAGQNSIGAATDGEVEDYAFEITAPTSGTVDNTDNTLSRKIADGTGGLTSGTLADGDRFGFSVTNLGDLNGDGVDDLAVGARFDNTGGSRRGAVHILFMNADGTVESSTKIAAGIGGLPANTLANNDYFGSSVANLGDLDGDGVNDLAVGSRGDDTGGSSRGAVHVLFLNENGTVKSSSKIAHETGGGPTLADSDFFGTSVANLGDLDGDGVNDLAVGARNDDTGGSGQFADRGAVHILFMNPDGTAKSSSKIAHQTGGGPTLANNDLFGRSVASLGDLDGDGIADLAVGANGDDSGGVNDAGAVHILLLDTDGTVKSSSKIAHETNGGPTLAAFDDFGTSIASLGDLDGDGVTDLAVGAYGDDTGGGAFSNRGAVHILLLNADGTAKSSSKIAHQTNGGPTLADFDVFGSSVASLGDLNGDGQVDLAVGAFGDDTGGGADSERGAVHVLFLEEVLPDFGDAPDTSGGTGAGNYRTTAADNGPSHGSAAGFGLRLGANIDGDDGTQQNKRANGDDIADSQTAAGFQFDDEDGVLSPATDLHGTIGAAPTVTLLVTNTTGRDATLSGWIDYNANGVFDNATERTQATIPTGSQDLRVTLTFPAIPSGSAGKTYARFRLSTDAAGQNSIGAATDGEVEDYAFEITAPSSGTVDNTLSRKIADNTGGLPQNTLANNDQFGFSVTNLGDLNGDGVDDLAVGARFDDTGGTNSNRGAVHILFMNENGTVESSTKIADGIGGLPVDTLADRDYFGSSVANLGDLDGDGVNDLAVGAYGDDTGGSSRGAVHVLLLNENGTVKSSSKIAHETGGGPTLADFDLFGTSVANLGDLDGDGVNDLAVGARGDDTGGNLRGAVHILLLNADGTAKSSTKIAHETGGGPVLANSDDFGRSVASLGDLDGDGIADLAVGARDDDSGGVNNAGAVHILLLNTDGTVKSSSKIAHETNGGPTLASSDNFGTSIASLGDVDGDGVTDLAVGAYLDDTGGDPGSDRGAVHILLLNADGTAKSSSKIAHQTNGGPTLAEFDRFGSSVASLGDLNGDGLVDLAVGANGDDTGGTGQYAERGAVHLLFLEEPDVTSPTVSVSLDDAALKIGETATVTFTFSEAPVDFAVDDVTVQNGNLSAFTATGDPLIFTATFTPSADTEDATNVISVGTGYTDAAGNIGTAGVSANYAIDTLAPTVNVALNDSALQIGETATVTFTFSEAPTGFAANDVTVQNGNLSAVTATGNPLIFNATFTPTADTEDATNVISVGTGYTDAAGNAGTAGASANYTIDTLAPTVAVTLDDSALIIGDTATVTFSFSEAPTGFAAGDVTVPNGNLSGLVNSGDPRIFIATFTPTADIEDATNVISVGTGYTDAAGNSGTAGVSGNYTIDTLAPTVNVALNDSALQIGETATVTFTFSEAPTGFAANDVTVQNGNLSAVTATGNPLIFNATFTPTVDTEDATNVISVGTGYTDAAGNTGTAGVSANYTIDTLAPTVAVTLDDSALKIGDTATVTFSFSEVPTGFAAGDVTAQNGNLSAFTATGNPLIFTATFTPTADTEDATNVISVGTGYTDAAGNAGTAGASANYTIDTLAPTVAVTLDDSALIIGDTATVTFSFSEAPVDFAASDVTAQNGNLSGLVNSGDPRIFIATFTPTADIEDATNVISVGTGYTDAAGNSGTAGASANYAIDTLAPTVAITPDGTVTTDSLIVFTFQFSEAVSGFVSGDITVTNGSAGTFTPVDGDTFTLEVTPTSLGSVTVSLAADVAQDALGNGNTSGSASVTSSAAGEVALPTAGNYEVVLDGGDLVVRTAGGGEQFRRVADSVTVLEIAGTAGDDVVSILNSGGAVSTPILFSGGVGDDLFNASLATGSTTLIGGSGDDTLTGGTVADFIIGGSGKDVISGGAGDDRLDGRSGRDTLTGGSGSDTIRGGQGQDSIDGGQEADVILGGGGPDTISGGDGNDRILGGPGRDRLDGDDGDDTMFGGPGADDLAGGLGNDTLNGVFRDDAFSQVVGPDQETGGQRTAPRPAPVSGPFTSPKVVSGEPVLPEFSSPLLEAESSKDGHVADNARSREAIDNVFLTPLLPELLEL